MQQLRYVIAVAEERSFTRAAERCRVVQSALSHQIKALERELGVTLFARSSRRVELTAAGDAFVVQARASVAAAERAVAAASGAAGVVRGTLRLGFIPTVTAIDLPAVLAGFHRDYPEVRVSLTVGGSDEMVRAIAGGELDAALLGFPAGGAPEGVSSLELRTEPLVAVVATDHPLAGHPLARSRARGSLAATVNMAELAEYPFVDFPIGTPGRAPAELAFRQAGIARDVPFEAADLPLMLGLVRSGLVVALVSEGAVSGYPGVRTIPVEGAPSRTQYLAWGDFNPSPVALAFAEAVRAHSVNAASEI